MHYKKVVKEFQDRFSIQIPNIEFQKNTKTLLVINWRYF